jgi:hypothetical protein
MMGWRMCMCMRLRATLGVNREVVSGYVRGYVRVHLRGFVLGRAGRNSLVSGIDDVPRY